MQLHKVERGGTAMAGNFRGVLNFVTDLISSQQITPKMSASIDAVLEFIRKGYDQKLIKGSLLLFLLTDH